uniref:Uncharacterized protein n=1 Tax=Arundo donax TaxID=35708 RepID=A0A0A9DWT4_ARUDO
MLHIRAAVSFGWKVMVCLTFASLIWSGCLTLFDLNVDVWQLILLDAWLYVRFPYIGPICEVGEHLLRI